MKKNTFYNLLNIILITTYLFSLLMQIYFPIFNISFSNYWFPAFCIFFGLSMFFKTIIFKSDSSFWLFNCFILIGISLLIFNVNNLPVLKYWPAALSIISVSSFMVGLVFKEIYQLKLALVVLLISVPFYLLVFEVINIWLAIAILLIAVWTSIYATRYLPERWYKNKKK